MKLPRPEKYTVKQFNEQFPTDAACLEFIFQTRFPNGGTCQCGKADCFYPVAGRRVYSCSWCGHQVSPCAGTIFHKSETSLRTWFFAMFLMGASKNGVSAKELQRQTGVTYKTAWRMNHQIRKLMAQGSAETMFSGIVEVDETFLGGRAKNMHASKRAKKKPTATGADKMVVAGVLNRDGEVRAVVVEKANAEHLLPNVMCFVEPGSTVCTDEFLAYKHVAALGFLHEKVAHTKGEYVRGDVHTNSLEGFWGQLKRSINGTFHAVSRKHLQRYVNEFAFRYNQRLSPKPVFGTLAARVAEQHASTN